MSKNDIDRAPIHGDIKNLHIPKVINAQMISGGFPCQDISAIGLQAGIENGERSSMFYEMMRIVDESDIKVVFLENVANILNCGIRDVIKNLTERDFNLSWVIKSASEMGAPHVRKRWFCLAVKKDFNLPQSWCDNVHTMSNEDLKVDWDNEQCPRYMLKTDPAIDPNWIQRGQTLGNSVVPCVVRQAFIELITMQPNWYTIKDIFSKSLPTHNPLTIPDTFPDSALIIDNTFVHLPVLKNYKNHHIDISLTFEDNDIKMPHFPTPRRGITHASSLTQRSLRDLPTVLVNSTQSLEHMRLDNITPPEKVFQIAIANVNYIEWMMGYPKDWTKSSSWTKQTNKNNQTQPSIISEDQNHDASSSNDTPKVKKQVKLNGMHMFMKDNAGKDIRETAQKWNALSQEEKNEYTRRAHEHNSKN
jgi:DNA (cytosine-5)-methyltransferase 1